MTEPVADAAYILQTSSYHGGKMMSMFRNLVMMMIFSAAVSVHAAGAKLLTKSVEETLEFAAKRSGRPLAEGTKITLGREMLKITAKHGDDVLPLIRNGGLEVLEQGIRHGDDFWKLCKAVPEASRSLALHSDELLPLAKRIGPDVLHLESKAPGLAVRFAKEFGDDGVRFVARKAPQDASQLLGYASKADSPATKRLFFETYQKSKNPSAFLQALNWKNIMAGGLSTAAIVSAYKVSDGIQEGIKDPKAAKQVVDTTLSPFRYALYALFAILLIPLGIKSVRWSIAAWKKSKI